MNLKSFLARAFYTRVQAKETSDWWSSLTPEQQAAYLAEHPNSKFAKDAKKTEETSGSPEDDDESDEQKTEDEDGERVVPSGKAALKPASADRKSWPAHIQALKLPPAWTDVHYSDDPKANLQAVGRDAKGRPQYVYSEEFSNSQAALKFARIHELSQNYSKLEEGNAAFVNSKDPVKKDHGECLSLIMKMGLRPGSTSDTGAEKQAFGATTLKAEHVVTEKGKMFLRFTGKKGVDLNLEVTDPDLQKMLARRKKAAGASQDLFPKVSAESLSAHTQALPPGGFKTKDMRTALGTRTANDLVESYANPPTDMASYKKAVKEVATEVSKKLGNTPTIALQSYISPQVFSKWASALEGTK